MMVIETAPEKFVASLLLSQLRQDQPLYVACRSLHVESIPPLMRARITAYMNLHKDILESLGEYQNDLRTKGNKETLNKPDTTDN